jgi:hypothetical protein
MGKHATSPVRRHLASIGLQDWWSGRLAGGQRPWVKPRQLMARGMGHWETACEPTPTVLPRPQLKPAGQRRPGGGQRRWGEPRQLSARGMGRGCQALEAEGAGPVPLDGVAELVPPSRPNSMGLGSPAVSATAAPPFPWETAFEPTPTLLPHPRLKLVNQDGLRGLV